jgi:hypothetical protein
MNLTSHRRSPLVWLLIILHILLGLGALVSGAMMMAVPDGSLFQMPTEMLQYTPFSNFFIPGLMLFSLLGVYPLLVAYSLWRLPAWRWPDALNPAKGMHWSWAASLAAGVIVLIWIIVQMLMLRAVDFLHWLYIIWGAALIGLTLTSAVRRYCAR